MRDKASQLGRGYESDRRGPHVIPWPQKEKAGCAVTRPLGGPQRPRRHAASMLLCSDPRTIEFCTYLPQLTPPDLAHMRQCEPSSDRMNIS